MNGDMVRQDSMLHWFNDDTHSNLNEDRQEGDAGRCS